MQDRDETPKPEAEAPTKTPDMGQKPDMSNPAPEKQPPPDKPIPDMDPPGQDGPESDT